MWQPTSIVTLEDVSMYVDILSSALDQWVTDLAGFDLIDYALLCRQELRAVSPTDRGSVSTSAYTALAAEIAYDRALIALCTERGIYAHATSFTYPMGERRRIEAVLRQAGLDLDSPPKRRVRNEQPSVADTDVAAKTHEGGSAPLEDQKAPPRTARVRAGAVPAALFDADEVSAPVVSEHQRQRAVESDP
jgi:hypothetical protein